MKRNAVREKAEPSDDLDDDSVNDGMFVCFKFDGLVRSVDASDSQLPR